MTHIFAIFWTEEQNKEILPFQKRGREIFSFFSSEKKYFILIPKVAFIC